MSRGRLVIGNWKMNPATFTEAVDLARAVSRIEAGAVEVGVAPPAVALQAVAGALVSSGVRVFAQDVHWAESGAYTGQISAAMLRGLAHGTLVGHSEVRRDQGDDDDRVASKLAHALGSGLRAVLCVGEREDELAAGRTEEVLRRQLGTAVRALPPGPPPVIAYEPVWAIGTGRPATAEHASAAARIIREALGAAGLDGEVALVLYGGSVTGANAPDFAAAAGIDGALVGGASLRPEEMSQIVRAFR